MNLKGLARASDDGAGIRQMLAGGPPLAVSVEEVTREDGTEIKGRLLVDAFGTKAGVRVTLRDADPDARYGGMARAFSPCEGGDGGTGPGDVVAFSSSFVRDGVAWVGKVGARTHAAQHGEVQVMTAMVRAGRARVSEKAKTTTQWIDVADGAAAAVARGVADVGRILSAAAARPWLGRGTGCLMRARDGSTAEFFATEGAGVDYLLEELEAQDAFGDGPLEIVPAWRLAAGREQAMREVNPRSAPSTPVAGPVSRLFDHETLRNRQGFLPCLLVTCDEDVWAFGGRTGKVARVAAGVQPLFRRVPLGAERLPSAVRAYGGTPNPVRTMHPAETVAARAQARREASGNAPAEDRNLPDEPTPAAGLSRADGSPKFPGLRRPGGPRP